MVLVQDSALNGIVPTGGAEARVQRIDDDVFPSNKYKDLILDRRVKDINPLALFQEFFKVASADPIVARGSIRLLCMGQLHNVFCILQLVANIYMVDKVLLPPEEERDVQTQTTRLFILTGLSFVPQAVMHALHYMSFSWKVVGRTRLRLASGLMNAFLYFDDAARTEVGSDRWSVGSEVQHLAGLGRPAGRQKLRIRPTFARRSVGKTCRQESE